MAAQRLKEAAEKAKIELSSAMSSQINLPFITADATGPKHLDMTLTRAKFNELTADLVDRTMTPVRIMWIGRPSERTTKRGLHQGV